MAAIPAAQWSVEDVKVWLLQQGQAVATEEVLSSFAENKIGGSDLLNLTADDIRAELQIKSLGTRKKLFTAVEQLRHTEGVKELRTLVPELRRCIQDDVSTTAESGSGTGGSPSSTPPEAEVKEVALAWDEEIARLEERLRDADFAARVNSVELSHCRCAEADTVEAQSLNSHLQQVQRQEREDAALAREVHQAGNDRTIREVLARASAASSTGGEVFLQAQIEELNAIPGAASSSSDHTAAAGACVVDSWYHGASAASEWEARPAGSRFVSKPGRARECVSCREKRGKTEELACGHIMCHKCLGILFMNAATDATLWPVRCCKQRVDMALAQAVLKPADYLRFTDKLEEVQATNKMYCVNPFCSHFINLDALAGDGPQYTCPRCDTDLCIACRTRWHPNISCEAWKQQHHAEDDAVLALAEEKGWKRCGKCRSLVQLAHGCNHMTCRCGHHFCYSCGSAWLAPTGKVEQQCKCDLWTEANLVQEERRRVAIVERVEQRRVAPVERAQIREEIVRGECEHGNWKERHYGAYGLNEECSNCGFYMAHYGYRCGYCRDMVCYTCRHHRLS